MNKSEDCIFCKIVDGELPSTKIIETDKLLVFKNLHPKRPIHLLIASKVHYQNLLEMPSDVWDDIHQVIKKLNDKYKPSGFRVASNIGKAALISHMHFHFLAPVKAQDGEI